MARWIDVRRIARRLPNVEETTSYGKPCFKIAGKLFARMSPHQPGALVVRVDLADAIEQSYRLVLASKKRKRR
jgi:hypothetical protein